MDNDKFKKIIESCHLNFLFGSGASRNYLGTLGNVEKLLTDLSREQDSDAKTVVDVSVKSNYFSKGIAGNIGIIDQSKLTDTNAFEATKLNYQEFLIALNVILLRRKSNLISKQVNLFTTNMDIFLDQGMEELNIEYNDGFTGKINPIFSTSNYRRSIFQKSPHYENKAELPLFNLFKLHGSVTWQRVGEKIVFDQHLTAANEVNEIILSTKMITSFDDGKGNDKGLQQLLTEAKDFRPDDSFLRFLKAYNKLVMINPTKDKFETTTIQYTFYELLRMYSNELEKENSVLFVLGFSFSDEHIREITKRVANSNPTLLICIFAHSNNSKKDIEEKLNLAEFKFKNVEVIIGGDLGKLNTDWFSRLAQELDEDLYKKKKADVIVNIHVPPSIVQN